MENLNTEEIDHDSLSDIYILTSESDQLSEIDLLLYKIRNKLSESFSNMSSQLYKQEVMDVTSNLEKYQEQPYLLDKYFENICLPLTNRLYLELISLAQVLHKQVLESCRLTEVNFKNPNIDELINYNLYHLSYCIYILCKIRGLKITSLYFPQDVKCLEIVIDFLTIINQADNDTIYKEDYEYNIKWYLIYVLYIWLTVLVLTPFPLNILDSKYTINSKLELFNRLLSIIIPKIVSCNACITKEVAALVFAKIVCRNDFINLWNENNKQYCNYYHNIISNAILKDSNTNMLLTFKYMLKIAPFENIEIFIPYIKNFLEWDKENLQTSISSTCSTKYTKYRLTCTSRLIIRLYQNMQDVNQRKYLFDVIPCTIKNILSDCYNNSSTIRFIAAKNLAKILKCISNEDEFNNIINNILSMLVNYSDDIENIFSHNSGNMTIDNPRINLCTIHSSEKHTISTGDFKEFGDLETATSNISDSNNYKRKFAICSSTSAYILHGKCLALAEIIRNNVLQLNLQYMKDIVEILRQCLEYEFWLSNRSISSQIRDSACYIVWNIARYYNPDIVKPYIQDLINCLIPLTVYDTNINVRRASCAALQELIGRQGANYILFGISIVTIADFFSISSIKSSFLIVSKKLAELSPNPRTNITLYDQNSNIINDNNTYTFSVILIKYLLRNVFVNPNPKHRLLGLYSFVELVPYARYYCYKVILPHILNISKKDFEVKASYDDNNPINRQWTIIVIAILIKLARNLTKNFFNEIIDKDIALKYNVNNWSDIVRNIVIQIEKKHLYRGKGGELTRKANLYLIVSLAESFETIPFKKATFTRYIKIVSDGLKHLTLPVQMSALSALEALIKWRINFNDLNEQQISYLPNIECLLDEIIEYINKKSTHIVAIRGYILAIGIIVSQLFNQINIELLKRSINCLINIFSFQLKNKILCDNSRIFINSSSFDAECRRNSILSIGIIFSNISESILNHFNDILGIISSILLNGCLDYSIDKRGDIGSWIREISLEVFTLLYTNPIMNKFIKKDEVLYSFLFNIFNHSDKIRVKALLLFWRILSRDEYNQPFTYLNPYWFYYRIFYGIPYEIFEVELLKRYNLMISNNNNSHFKEGLEFIDLKEAYTKIISNERISQVCEYNYLESFFTDKENTFNCSCIYFDQIDCIEKLPEPLLPYINFDKHFIIDHMSRNIQISNFSNISLVCKEFLPILNHNLFRYPILIGLLNWINHSSTTLPSSNIAKNEFLYYMMHSNNSDEIVQNIFIDLKLILTYFLEIESLNKLDFIYISSISKLVQFFLEWEFVKINHSNILLEVINILKQNLESTSDILLLKSLSSTFISILFYPEILDNSMITCALNTTIKILTCEYPCLRIYASESIYKGIHSNNENYNRDLSILITNTSWNRTFLKDELIQIGKEFERHYYKWRNI
ncbi:HEAT repeat family protein [Cryptosporidium andersoni]|uniref:HEAT repeat family protein n=1 Tax=Cryptosporidium andersoni TaxID=117008 RepID=A0A1J4MVD0_9CRYT|nr:HEAT repeat family protein [Cryptosporidium andersoni]